MEKGQLPLLAELTLADIKDCTTKTGHRFTGTSNPRHLRVIHSLLIRPRKREEIDHIAGASNSPELIAELRRRGLAVPCDKAPAIDRDGYPVKSGVYSFTEDDRHAVEKWLRKRDAKAKGV